MADYSKKQLVQETWQFLTLIYTGSSLQTYVNGELISETSTPENVNTCSGGTLRIGKWWSGDLAYYEGIMDELRIFKRSLSQAEVLALYNECATPTAIETTEEMNSKGISLFSNPSAGSIQLYNADAQPREVSVFSAEGQLVLTTVVPSGNSSLLLSNSGKGLFLLKSQNQVLKCILQ